MLASLIFASHLRQIRKRVERAGASPAFTPAKSPKGRRSSVRARFSLGEIEAVSHSVFSQGGDRIFFVMIVSFVIVDCYFAAVTGSYQPMPFENFDMLVYAYSSMVMLIVGVWFIRQVRRRIVDAICTCSPYIIAPCVAPRRLR